MTSSDGSGFGVRLLLFAVEIRVLHLQPKLDFRRRFERHLLGILQGLFKPVWYRVIIRGAMLVLVIMTTLVVIYAVLGSCAAI